MKRTTLPSTPSPVYARERAGVRACRRTHHALTLTLPRRTGRGNRKAFTLVELLVVIGIISVLVGLLLPSLGAARQMARRCRALSDVRQLMIGYTDYVIANRSSLPWGYPPSTVNGVPVRVDLTNGTTVGGLTAQRYPWRLFPHVGKIWPILHQHDAVPADDYSKGVAPSFGLNTVFLGGHDGPIYQGFIGDRPNVGKHVAFKTGEINRPTEQIVFAESLMTNAGPLTPADIPHPGLHYVTPPRSAGERWRVENEQFVVTTGQLIGIPKGRYGKSAVVAFFDGHAESRRPSELTDMRLWAPRATSSTYDYVP